MVPHDRPWREDTDAGRRAARATATPVAARRVPYWRERSLRRTRDARAAGAPARGRGRGHGRALDGGLRPLARGTPAAPRARCACRLVWRRGPGGRAGPLAVTSLREAVALEPDRPEYRLALAKALVAQGHNREAMPYVNDVLRQEPVHGEANLVLARILRDTGASTEAESAYYRAIFGRWAPAQLASRQQARLELVALYEQAGETARLRAALLELSAAFPG